METDHANPEKLICSCLQKGERPARREYRMNEEIFRKKNLARIKSPENLDDYIRVSNPGVWLLLISVIILLAGACVWGIFGHIDSTVASTVCVENDAAVCYISDEDLDSVEPGMTVSFAGTEAVIDKIGEKEELGYACILKADRHVPDGLYEGTIVTHSVKPLSFVLN